MSALLQFYKELKLWGHYDKLYIAFQYSTRTLNPEAKQSWLNGLGQVRRLGGNLAASSGG